jgi:uncharacterized protein YdeI (YjbR/CyaY-like superfamily)
LEKVLSFDRRKDWHDWLIENHSGSEGIWLRISKKRSSAPGISYEDSVEEAICFGWIDGQMKSNDIESFILRFSPRRKGSIWSELNRERALRLIKSGAMTAAGMEKVKEAKRNGRWASAYSSKKKPKMPEPLKNALSKEGTLQPFNALPNSRQLAYIYWINNAKKDETKELRIAETVMEMKRQKRLR